jgi:hypothetical protein
MTPSCLSPAYHDPPLTHRDALRATARPRARALDGRAFEER